ncbi:MAG: hypothetical protein U1F70_07290 [Candidatus Competibacteraceae bacterium]
MPIKSEFHPIAAFWQSPPDALLTRSVVGQVLGKSVSWLERAALNGDGPAFCRLGRHALYRKADVLDYIEKNASPRVLSTSELAGRMTTSVHSPAYRGWSSFRADLLRFIERLDSILEDVQVSGDTDAGNVEIISLIRDLGIARFKAIGLLERSQLERRSQEVVAD